VVVASPRQACGRRRCALTPGKKGRGKKGPGSNGAKFVRRPRSPFRPGRLGAHSAPRRAAWVRQIYPALGTGDFSPPRAGSRRTEVHLPQVPTEVGVPRGTARGLRPLGNRGEMAETTIKARSTVKACRASIEAAGGDAPPPILAQIRQPPDTKPCKEISSGACA
jgi:hypothetical protein